MRDSDKQPGACIPPSRRRFLRQATTGTAAAAFATTTLGLPAAGVLGANERLGVSLIGAGGRGSAHFGILARMKAGGTPIDLVSIADVYRGHIERGKKRFGVEKGFMNHRELLEDPAVDLVCIATPDHAHGPQAIDAVKAGKDVYCEKPVTHWRQFDVTKKLAETVAASDRVFQLGTQAMSDSVWHQMKRLVREGLIGQPLFGETGFFRTGDWGERGMPITDKNARPGKDLDWEAFLGDSPKREFSVDRFFRWRLFEDYAGGPVTDLYPHSFTQVADILGVGFPAKVVATGGIHRYAYELREVPDTFNLLAEYPEKVTISMLGTQGNDFQGTGRRGAGQRVPIIRGWDGSLTIDRNEIVFTPIRRGAKKPQRIRIEAPESMNRHWGKLIECCQKRDKNTYSPMDLAYRVQTVMHMAMLGMRGCKVATFDAASEKIVL